MSVAVTSRSDIVREIVQFVVEKTIDAGTIFGRQAWYRVHDRIEILVDEVLDRPAHGGGFPGHGAGHLLERDDSQPRRHEEETFPALRPTQSVRS